MQFLWRRAAGEKVGERTAGAGNLVRRLVDKLKPEVTNSRREPSREVRAGLLRFRSENSIAAADVRSLGDVRRVFSTNLGFYRPLVTMSFAIDRDI